MTQIEKETPVRSDATINRASRSRRLPARLVAITAGFVLAAGLAAPPAMASFGITSFTSSLINEDLSPATQAGSHPWESITSFTFSAYASGLPTENVQSTIVDLPPGLVGNPNATAKCTVAQLDLSNCPGESQLGDLTLSGNSGFGPFSFTAAVYNMVPPAGMPAQFGARILILNSFVDVSVIPTGSGSDGGYTLRTSVNNISAGLPLSGTSLTLWGVPADPSHDADRVCPGFTSPCSSTGPLTPFLTTPTSCTGPLTAKLTAWSWQSPTSIHTATAQSPGMTGCDQLQFHPSLTAQPTTSVADSPSGLDIDLHVPQAPDDPDALATPALKTAVVRLPAGLVVNASSADGLAACAPAQIGLGSSSAPSCPDASKIGTVRIDSPIQSDPLEGSIYLAQQGSNPFGSLLAIYVSAESDGVLLKLAGRIDSDPSTGQLTTTFDNNPQLPFTDLKLHFFSGPRAALATPESCGSFTTTGALTPWSGTPAATASDSFNIGSGCVSGFSPSFSAGVSNLQAGASSPFGVTFSRSDSDQELSGLSLSLPPGLLAKVAGVPLCSDADAGAGTCPAASLVGTARVGAGAGSNPLFLSGNVYLTGPYKGAPYSLAVVVPANAGPFTLGTVVVRQAINIDLADAHVTVASDPLPTIIGSIPLRMRRIDVNLDRPGFIINPTSCDPTKIDGLLTSVGGTQAAVSSRFQVAGCQGLAFKPTVTAALTGNGQTKSGRHPGLRVTVRQSAGQANLKSVSFALPRGLSLDAKRITSVCSLAQAQSHSCPAATAIGTATAETPLVSGPLTGKVFLVQGAAGGLPTLLVPLRGAIALDLRAQSATRRGRLVTTFGSIPDAPVTKFTLTITGGSKGILVLGPRTNVCNKKPIGFLQAAAHSGKTTHFGVTARTPCKKKKATKKKRSSGRAA